MKKRFIGLQIGILFCAMVALGLLAGRSILHLSSSDPIPDPDADYRSARRVIAHVTAAAQEADFERIFMMNVSWNRERITAREFERVMRQRINRIAVSKRIEVGHITIQGDQASAEIYLIGYQDRLHLGLITLNRENGEWLLDNIRIDPVSISSQALPRLRI